MTTYDSPKHVHLIRSGTITPGQPLTITKTAKEAHIKYSDTKKVAIFVSPEGSHEAWSVARADNQITINVWDRSGTNRVGYSGNVNWAIVEVSPAISGSGVVASGVSNTGSFTIHVPRGVSSLGDSDRYAIFICPESGHEGWSMQRVNTDVNVNVWNRSGTSRIGYSGNVSWMVIDMQANSATYPFIKSIKKASGSEILTSEGPAYEDTSESCVLVCPQAGHEAWTTTRSASKITSSIWDRSGTSRVGYGGIAYQMVLKATPDVDPNVYGVGVNVITLLPSQTIELFAFGGGGGGGASTYTGGNTNYPGGNGGDTIIKVGSRTYTLGGGKGGTGGWWGNGSHMSEGEGGAGGVATVSGNLPNLVEQIAYETVIGTMGHINRWSPQHSVSPTKKLPVISNSNGGTGAWGIGDESRAGGGSGGTGAGLRLKLTNNGAVSVSINITVGGRGSASAGPNNNGSVGGEGVVYLLSSEVAEVKKKTLTANLIAGGANRGTASVEFMYIQAETGSIISIPDTYKKNHINLWDYFQEVNGRRPNAGEAITFIIPENRIFVAPFGYTAALREILVNTPIYSYVNERPFRGSAAVSLVGWDPLLNNKITIDVRGKLIGSFNNPPTRSLTFMPYDKATGERLKWDTFKNFTGFPSVSAAWFWMHYLCSATFNSWITGYPVGNPLQAFVMLDPIKNPAIQSWVDVKVIIRAGAYVIGGGGVQNARGIYSRTDVPSTFETGQGSVHDKTNTNGGDAIVAETGANITVENYGYLSGGGGGGASVGVDVRDIANWDNGINSQGGFAAPLGGVPLVEFPMYFDLEYIKTIPLYTMSGFIPSTASRTLAEDMMMDEASFQAHLNARKGIDYTHERANASIDTTRIGHDANGDCVIDISKVRDAINNTNRFLSPTAGAQVSNIAGDLNVISGSGGAPGVDGQMSTVVTGPAWLQAYPRVAGTKGVALRRKSDSTFTYLSFPGSIINP